MIVAVCWKLYDTLIILNSIDIYEGFRLFIHNWANLHAARVCRPIYATVPRAYYGTVSIFPSNKPRIASGSQPKRNSKIVESSE